MANGHGLSSNYRVAHFKASNAFGVFLKMWLKCRLVNELQYIWLLIHVYSKNMDGVNHFVLFSKLMNRNVPINIVILLSSWYGKSVDIVNWHGTFSHKFSLSAGVRHGGCHSPILFSIHVNVLIEKILKTDLGCHINLINFGIVMYADDLILVSSSISQMQKMVDLCVNVLDELDLKINVNKAACIRVGARFCEFLCQRYNWRY